MAATGIAVLWLPDVHVYHSLLEAWFTKGLELEDDYRQLLGTRRLIVDSRGFLPGDLRIPVPVSITAFYCLVALVVLLSAFFLSPARDGRGELLCTCRWAASGVIFLVVSSIAFYRAYTMQPLRKPARE